MSPSIPDNISTCGSQSPFLGCSVGGVRMNECTNVVVRTNVRSSLLALVVLAP